MTEPERRAAELRTLLAWMTHQSEVVARVAVRLDRAERRAADGTDAEIAAAAALFLQHYYTGIEDALLRIAEELDGTVPPGEEWHRLLLDQMTLDIPNVRPALLTNELKRSLDVLHRFRHRTRHAYDEDYDWRRMTEPLEARVRAESLLPSFFAHVETVVRDIILALERAL